MNEEKQNSIESRYWVSQLSSGTVPSSRNHQSFHNFSTMVFKSPNWVPSLPAPPDSIPVSEFVLNEKYGRRSLSDSRDTYTCGISGKSHSVSQVRRRRDNLAKSLRQELGWEVNSGSEYDKVATIFCPNTVSLFFKRHELWPTEVLRSI